ncbi:MAG: putative cytochrome P450 126 [Acidimicrobiales bacterium]|nr:MAG: cytochrome P450 [Actinomycetota bacterium]MBV6509018.1 putative cytochrome P450 126 [Acidimicrobiales bacterium]RIK06269.1 MAG: cytochrome P450 [Acidobacteriota bacterium]
MTIDLDSIDLTDLSLFTAGPPHEVFRRLRDDAPVFWHAPTAHTPDGEGFWCLTRHDDVVWGAREAALLSSCTGGDRAAGGTLIEDLPLHFAAGVLLNMQDDPRHHHIRKLVTPSVSPRSLRRLEAELAVRCGDILDAAIAQGECDFLVEVAAELPLQAIASLVGVPQADRHRFMEWADAALDYRDRELGEQSERSLRAGTEMFQYGSRLLAQKRACPADDLLSVIATAQLPEEAGPGGPLTDIEQQMFFNLLVAAGSETTRNAITAGLLGLVEHPEQWGALKQDRSLLDSAVEEMLRWASSTTYNRRTATADIERHGQTISAGEKVVLWWQAANFDERAFDHPMEFDIRRDPNPHLTFGIGTHFCLGAKLARLEMRLVFDGLLDRVDALETAGPIERTRSNKHAGFRHAPVRFRV